MVRRKRLSPSGNKDDDSEYRNAHINLHMDELRVAGMEIGEDVYVRVRDGMLIIQKSDQDSFEHRFTE
jgi:hypothetical protein